MSAAQPRPLALAIGTVALVLVLTPLSGIARRGRPEAGCADRHRGRRHGHGRVPRRPRGVGAADRHRHPRARPLRSTGGVRRRPGHRRPRALRRPQGRLRRDLTQNACDRYGQLLRHLDVAKSGKDIGRSQIARGLAAVYLYEDPFARVSSYERAADAAQQAGRGVWSACGGISIGAVAPFDDWIHARLSHKGREREVPLRSLAGLLRRAGDRPGPRVSTG
jgi:hypothetical protein